MTVRAPGVVQPGNTASGSSAEVADEQRVNAWFDRVTASGGARAYALRHPVETASALLAIRRLPRLDADLSRTGDGPAAYWPLHRSPLSRALMDGVTAVLRLPETPAAYSEGASKQTLRRKSRAAVKAGITWAEITDRAERAEWLRIAHASEQRDEPGAPQPVLDGLDEIALWLVAYDRSGAPVLLSVTPVDSGWAVLRYFRTLVSGEEASVARYHLAQVLAERLIDDGVRYLADSLSPLRLSPGVRHFQRMLGYRLVRVRARCR